MTMVIRLKTLADFQSRVGATQFFYVKNIKSLTFGGITEYHLRFLANSIIFEFAGSDSATGTYASNNGVEIDRFYSV